MRLFFTLTLILTITRRSWSTYTNNRLYYSVNSLLVCYVNNPYYYLAGQPQVIPEVPPKLTLVPNLQGRVWIPGTSNYSPVSNNGETIDVAGLLSFLGQDFNGQLLSVSEPSLRQAAPLPTVSTSSTPISNAGGSGGGMFMQPTTPPPVIDPSFFNYVSYVAASVGLGGSVQSISNALLSRGIGDCELRANWTLLPDTYFPRYISGGYCADPSKLFLSCSLPSGLHCTPNTDPSSLTYVTILRWDCCNTYSQGQWQWSCGWRKVLMPIVSQCFCGCI